MSRKSKKPDDWDCSQLETYRQSLHVALSFTLFLSIVSILFFGAFFLKSHNLKDVVPTLLLIIMGYWSIRGHITAKYTKKLEKKFLPGLIKTLWPGSKYHPAEGLLKHEFEAGKIFLYEINDYASSNLIKAHDGKAQIQLSAVTAAYHPYGAKGSAKIFQGLFLIADFNKNTSGRTYVLPDNAERLLGKPGQDLQSISKSHGKLVKLEDTEFEKYFAAYSTNQVEARYILSPSLMQNLLTFRQQIKQDVFASFIDGKMYLGWSNGVLVRNASLFTELTPDTLTAPFSDLTAVHDLIEKSLTTRIWTKE